MLPLHRQDLQGPSDDIDVNSFLPSVLDAWSVRILRDLYCRPRKLLTRSRAPKPWGATLGITSSYVSLSSEGLVWLWYFLQVTHLIHSSVPHALDLTFCLQRGETRQPHSDKLHIRATYVDM
jgi:hypothetical protein